jgi:hypothetical protein
MFGQSYSKIKPETGVCQSLIGLPRVKSNSIPQIFSLWVVGLRSLQPHAAGYFILRRVIAGIGVDTGTRML